MCSQPLEQRRTMWLLGVNQERHFMCVFELVHFGSVRYTIAMVSPDVCDSLANAEL